MPLAQKNNEGVNNGQMKIRFQRDGVLLEFGCI